MTSKLIYFQISNMLTEENSTPTVTVTELNQQVKSLLESGFDSLWIEGEISNFSCPASGHWYFSLKDDKSQVRCAMFRGRNGLAKFLPENGLHVLLHAKVSLYTGRGDYQLIVDHIEEVGAGALQRAFEQLKKKLLAEGLFEQQYKKPLPTIPKQLGIITSATGAALHDILHVLKKRCPSLPVIIYPSLVQGDDAPTALIKAIQLADKRQECDALIIARGGGSLEDLWAFNDETLARAIFAATIPIVSGVGHEVDFTITDFVADYRAPTPSAAAEFISPDQRELQSNLKRYYNTLNYHMINSISHYQQTVDYLETRLKQQHPQQYLQNQKELLAKTVQSLRLAQLRVIENKQGQFQRLAHSLNTLSPLATLSRGYSITRKIRTDKKAGAIIYSTDDINIKDQLRVKLHQGEFDCTVSSITSSFPRPFDRLREQSRE
ncbi:MAG: exodeoxyribonuclease VII large subunit [Pseudomonadota bacterium]